jgi:hypothetical protein
MLNIDGRPKGMDLPVNHVYTALESIVKFALPAATSKYLRLDDKSIVACRSE